MARTRRTKTWVLALLIATLAACGGEGDGGTVPTGTTGPTEPSPTTTAPAPSPLGEEDLTFSSGEASVTATGNEELDLTVPLESATYTGEAPDDEGELNAQWREDTGERGLYMTLTVEGGELTDAFVRVDGEEQGYPDGFHTQCELEVSRMDEEAVEGTFTCDELPSFDGETAIDAEGTFSLSA